MFIKALNKKVEGNTDSKKGKIKEKARRKQCARKGQENGKEKSTKK